MIKSVIIVGILCQILFVFSQPTVRVEQGKILGEGIRFENDYLDIQKDIDLFLGIPYAEPPVGERRFKAPLPKAPWSEDEIYNATYYRDICVQKRSLQSYGFTTSEDCLYLNVYAPNPKPTNASVMVFIHGGGFMTGSGYFGSYSGIPLSSVGDVIVVTLNYRLSAFGYLTTGDEASPGNYGMLDQVEALRWVKTNIQAFGGDPNMITIFGESAGAASVSAHLFSPLSRDLFNQAILESGSIFSPWAFHYDLDAQREMAFKVGEEVGCPATSTHELISCMRQVDAQEIDAAANKLFYQPAPCVDNNFLVESPLTSFEKDNYKKCPLINGFNKDEGTLYISISELGGQYLNSSIPPFVSEETFEEQLNQFLTFSGFYTNDLIEDSAKQQYVDWAIAENPEADYFDPWNYLTGDASFVCPASMETRSHAMAGEYDVYQYYFTHVPSISVFATEYFGPGWLGAGHAEELAFVFGYPIYPTDLLEFHEYSEEELSLSKHVMKYWTNFAKTGNPNQETESSLPYDDDRAWPTYTFPNLEYKEIAVNLTSGRGVRADECHFWNDYLKQLTTFTADLVETERQWREEFYTWKYTDMEEWRDAFDEYEAVVGSKNILSSRDEL
ncbi:cholinesterase-like isoform X2 [Amphiura filiformis]|uniref:cholinesterase-like isoform X2 n=1 Tax=Amphiura filiformis TaxID=82378 RepID=UPI003B225E8A